MLSRPWVSSPPVPPMKSSQTQVVRFPEEDESMGEFSISFFGPDVDVCSFAFLIAGLENDYCYRCLVRVPLGLDDFHSFAGIHRN
jgi:hypothetical protein